MLKSALREVMPGLTRTLTNWALRLAFDQGEVDPRISTIREGTQTYFDAAGVMQTAAANTLVIDHDPVTHECLGASIWGARTNLLTYSEQFDNAAWGRSRISGVIPNAAIAPDGTLTADKLVEDTQTGAHYVHNPATFTAGTAFTGSVYFKAAERTHGAITLHDGVGFITTVFDLTAKTVIFLGSGCTAKCVDQGNGWVRCISTLTPSVGITSRMQVQSATSASLSASYTGDGTSGIYIWGAQLEAGSSASPYIPTYATFTSRASTGSYFDVAGVMRYAAVNAARNNYDPVSHLSKGLLLEGAATNLLTYSEDFSNTSGWGPLVSGTVTSNTTIAPDGALTADTYTQGADNIFHANVAITDSVAYTKSVYLHSNTTAAFIRLRVSTAAGAVSSWFNWTTKSVAIKNAGFTGGEVVSVGGGWYRINIQYTPAVGDGGSRQFALQATTAGGVGTADTGKTLVLWGAQLEAGSVATSYIPTLPTFTSRTSIGTYFDVAGVMQLAASNTARYDFDPVSHISKGMLLESAATNLLWPSIPDSAGTSFWSNGTAITSVTNNAAVAPDGTLTATKFVGLTGNSNSSGGASLRAQMGVFAAGTYVFSFYAYAATGGNPLSFRFVDVGAGLDTAVNCSVSDGGTDVMTTGWRRYYATITLGTGSSNFTVITSLVNTYDVYIWGAQLETGTQATSYIPTVASQVTRSADVSSSTAVPRAADVSSSATVTRPATVPGIYGADFTGFYNQNEGTFVVEFNAPLTANIFDVSDGTVNNVIDIALASSSFGFSIYAAGAYQGSGGKAGAYSAGWNVISAGYKANDLLACINGTSGTVDASATIPAVTQMVIGRGRTATSFTDGYLKSITYFPVKLSNSELQVLSQ